MDEYAHDQPRGPVPASRGTGEFTGRADGLFFAAGPPAVGA